MARGRRVKRICEECSKEFESLLIKVRQGGGKFCSTKCHHRNRAKNKRDVKQSNVFYQKKCKYGLTKEAYLTLFEEQDNKCRICSIDFDETTAYVDHSHETGEVRGLLCRNCNTLLGMAKDNAAVLQRAIEYLNRV